MRASAVTDITANLLGKFYGIAGFTFLLLTLAFAIIGAITISAVKDTYRHLYDAHGTRMIIAAFVLTIPLLIRSIFDLCIGTNESVRDTVGVTD